LRFAHTMMLTELYYYYANHPAAKAASSSLSPTADKAACTTAVISAAALVALCMPVKEVLALPGDRVRFTPDGIYRNGQLIPHTAPEPGIPRCPFSDIAVPRYFFVGDGTLDPDSWGSRYMCFIPQSIIEGTVTRVW